MQLRADHTRRQTLSFGSLYLDWVTNGCPRGQITQISGMSNSGKTLLGLSVARSAKQINDAAKPNPHIDPVGNIVVLDSERRWDEVYARMSGLGAAKRSPDDKDGDYYLIPSTTREANWNMIIDICYNNIKLEDPRHPDYVGFILWDSFGNAPSTVTIAAQLGDNMQPGHDARINNEAAKKAMQAVDDAGIWMVAINSIYKKIGAAYNKVSNDWSEDYVRKGGEGIRLATSTGIDLFPMNDKKKNKDSRTGGATMRGQTFKNVNGRMSYLEFEFDVQIEPYLWINKYQEIAELGVIFGVFRDKNGEKNSNGNAVMHLDGKKLCALGKDNATLAEYLAQNRSVAEDAEVKLRECMATNEDYVSEKKPSN